MSDELKELISDEAIQAAWFGSWPDNVDRREVIFDTLMKYAGDFSSGYTATSICADLGLLLGHKKGRDITLSKKGRKYLYYATKHALQSRPTPVITDGMVAASAKVIADYIGHGMREKCMTVAKAALTAALPHAVDAAGVYNQAVEDVAKALESEQAKYLDNEQGCLDSDDIDGAEEAQNMQETIGSLLGIVRALKNPTATAPDAAAIRREVVEELVQHANEKAAHEVNCYSIDDCLRWFKELQDKSHYHGFIPSKIYQILLAIRALAAGKGV